MALFDTSSGDTTADRRADYAEMLFGSGEPAPAAEILLGALELAPAWAMGWFRLGEYHEAAGEPGAALNAWRMACTLDPDDRAGAGLKLALAGEGPPPAAPPSVFVETLFDQYAKNFDHALVDTLGYRLPELLAETISSLDRPRFRLAIDLGCGTGLMGERLRPFCDWLVGYDISAEMLTRAKAKGVYNVLMKADLQTLVYDGDKADLVTAADVFNYIGALDRMIAAVRGMVSPGGLFAFSVETLADGDGFALQASRRYAHSESYVRCVLAQSGLEILKLEPRIIRQDRLQPVEGLIVVAKLRSEL